MTDIDLPLHIYAKELMLEEFVHPVTKYRQQYIFAVKLLACIAMGGMSLVFILDPVNTMTWKALLVLIAASVFMGLTLSYAFFLVFHKFRRLFIQIKQGGP